MTRNVTRERVLDDAVWAAALREYVWTARQTGVYKLISIGVRDILRRWLRDGVPLDAHDRIEDIFARRGWGIGP